MGAVKTRRRTPSERAGDAGATAQRAATVAMRKVTGGGSVLAGLGEQARGAELAVLQGLEATDHTHSARATVSLNVEKAAIMEVAAGASPARVEVEYHLHQGFVSHALKRRFGSPEAAKLALQGFVLENALACQVVAAQTIHEMSATQAIMGGSILIDKALALEKSIADQPKTINFAALADMAKTLKVLREISVGPGV